MRRGFEAVGGQCVFTCEWDKHSQTTYRANFGEDVPIFGDIQELDPNDVPPHDVLAAGFPCQPFSLAGRARRDLHGTPHGFADQTQGTLFFDLARIIAHCRPRAFLLENVKHLLSHDQGRTFRTIRHVLEDELGYHVSYRVIPARNWLPQHRERVFIVGFRDGWTFHLGGIPLPPAIATMADIMHPEDGSEPPEPPYTLPPDGTVDPRYTISDRQWAQLQGHAAAPGGWELKPLMPSDVSRTLTSSFMFSVIIAQSDLPPRRITPREMARLMGFDDFRIPVSDAQARRQFGNAVCPPVVRAIAECMVPHVHFPAISEC